MPTLPAIRSTSARLGASAMSMKATFAPWRDKTFGERGADAASRRR